MALMRYALIILVGVSSFQFFQQGPVASSTPPCSEETAEILHWITPEHPHLEQSRGHLQGKRIRWNGLVNGVQETLWGTEIAASCLSGYTTVKATISFDVSAKDLGLAPGQRLEALADLEGIDTALNVRLIHGQIAPFVPLKVRPGRPRVTQYRRRLLPSSFLRQPRVPTLLGRIPSPQWISSGSRGAAFGWDAPMGHRNAARTSIPCTKSVWAISGWGVLR